VLFKVYEVLTRMNCGNGEASVGKNMLASDLRICFVSHPQNIADKCLAFVLFFSGRSLLDRLTGLWVAFEKEMNTSVSDCLSLLHLGLLLEHLAQIGEE
jgi:hypothetical protein